MKNRIFLMISTMFLFGSSCMKHDMNEKMMSDGSAASRAKGQGIAGAVYTLSNQPASNDVIVYGRAASGDLVPAGSYSAGGTGTGTGLGSQGALVLTGDWLLAVNAGSNTISSLKVSGQGLLLTSTVPSGGLMPISITEHNGIVYVLNAGGSGNISGFLLEADGDLVPVAGSTRPLSTPASAPAQVSFVADGSSVVVTEKATNKIITYAIDAAGMPGAMHSISSSTPTPFGFDVASTGYIYVSEAAGGAPGASAVSSYYVAGDGAITPGDGPVSAGQTAACWVVLTNNEKYFYATNTGSSNISSFSTGVSGDISVLSAIAAGTGAGSGPIDAALSNGSKYLYVLSAGTNTVSAFSVSGDGSLTGIQTVGGLPAGAVGLAAK
jgi:6-phosphogluconolactonase